MKYEEILYLFATKIIKMCQIGKKYSKLIFNIKEEDFKEFEVLVNNTNYNFIDDNIKKLKRINEEEMFISDLLEEKYIIDVHDLQLFITLLNHLVNEELKKIKDDSIYSNSQETKVVEYILLLFLRANEYDFKHIEKFLRRQLDFMRDNTFEKYNEETKCGNYLDCDIYVKNDKSLFWDETPYHFSSKLKKEEKIHDLSKIHYGISTEGEKKVCYIYGVQKIEDSKRENSIERKLYKLNKDKEYTSVHPNQVYALIVFTEELLKEGIEEIRIPTTQVLNYSYHELLSMLMEQSLKSWEEEDLENLSDEMMDSYQYDLKEYMKFYNKSDEISKLKTEKLYELLFRLLEHFDNLELINDLYTVDDSLKVRVRKEAID